MIATTDYKFVCVKVHPACDTTSWYLVVDDYDMLTKLHQSASVMLFQKFGQDPHLFDKGMAPRTDGSVLYNPIKLGAGWLTSAIKGLTEYGKIYVNRNHGMLFGNSIDVLEEKTSEKLHFPVEETHKEGVRIKISRYADGSHYYLNSNIGTVFSKHKFNTSGEAYEEAKRHAFESNITHSDNRPYSRDGD